MDTNPVGVFLHDEGLQPFASLINGFNPLASLQSSTFNIGMLMLRSDANRQIIDPFVVFALPKDVADVDPSTSFVNFDNLQSQPPKMNEV